MLKNYEQALEDEMEQKKTANLLEGVVKAKAKPAAKLSYAEFEAISTAKALAMERGTRRKRAAKNMM